MMRLSVERMAAATAWDALVHRYCEPHRAYHNLSHILALLRHMEAVSAHVCNRDAVELTIWFHDVIYDTHAADNEEQSAAFARRTMQTLGIAPILISPVEDCILATKKHEVSSPDIADQPTFLDMDLAILGAREEVYRRYAQAIRAEYGWVPADEYKKGRSQVLNRFLARPALFFTHTMAAQFEIAARKNIEQELQELPTL